MLWSHDWEVAIQFGMSLRMLAGAELQPYVLEPGAWEVDAGPQTPFLASEIPVAIVRGINFRRSKEKIRQHTLTSILQC